MKPFYMYFETELIGNSSDKRIGAASDLARQHNVDRGHMAVTNWLLDLRREFDDLSDAVFDVVYDAACEQRVGRGFDEIAQVMQQMRPLVNGVARAVESEAACDVADLIVGSRYKVDGNQLVMRFSIDRLSPLVVDQLCAIAKAVREN